jgi:hypothetical protein
MHPTLQTIPKIAVTEEDIPYFNAMIQANLITEDEHNYYKKIGFPRLLIKIKDKQLEELSKITHPEHYKYLHESKLPSLLVQNMQTINDIKVRQIQDKQPDKIGFMKILGTNINFHEKEVMMYGKNKQTLFAAAKRQMKTAPTPSATVAKDFIQYATSRIENEIGYELDHFSYDVTQWYNHLSAAKQQVIKPIKMYYERPDLHRLLYSEKERQRQLTLHYEAIVKAELQPADGKPRMVCSIPQRIKYTMGPVCWQLEELMAHKLNGYCGGMNLTEMAEKINNYAEQGFTKVVEGDGSAFDNSQDITLKALDRYIYNRIKDKIYHVPKEEFELLSNLHYKTMDVKYHDNGKPKTYMTYKVLGTVFSGDSDTTLANTIRMAMYNIYANERSGLKYGVDFVVFSKGDDFSVLYKQRISDTKIRSVYEKYFLGKPVNQYKILDNRRGGLGQICKFLDIGDLSSFKFCSLRSWYVDDSYNKITLTRDPKKLYNLALYSIKAKSKNWSELVQYHIDLAVSYEKSYPGIEIFEIMAEAHRREARKIYEKYHNMPEFKKKLVDSLARTKRMKEHLFEYDFGFGDIFNARLKKLYEIQGRQDSEDLILPNYWDNMQLRYNIRTEQNTILELKYINDQINAEFDTEELKSLVGLINFNEY